MRVYRAKKKKKEGGGLNLKIKSTINNFKEKLEKQRLVHADFRLPL